MKTRVIRFLWILPLLTLLLGGCDRRSLEWQSGHRGEIPSRGAGKAPAVVVDGNKEGNGGDHIRPTFIKMGQAVIVYLTETEEGKELVAKHALDVPKLTSLLSIDHIKVETGVLKDNGASDVDATGRVKEIVLQYSNWLDHFDHDRDVYYLVFHEMLRGAGCNDNEYPISDKLRPFPKTLRIMSRITPTLPLVEEDLANVIRVAGLSHLEGNRCGPSDARTHMEFDGERNIFNVALPGVKAFFSDTPDRTAEADQTCKFSIPFRLPIHKRLTISMLDAFGQVQSLSEKSRTTMEVELSSTGNRSKLQLFSRDVRSAGRAGKGRIQLRLSEPFQSECGESSTLRLRTSVRVDDLDGSLAFVGLNGISLYFRLDDCAASK